MSGVGDRPAGRDERLACRRFCDGESGPEGLVEKCRSSPSQLTNTAVKVQTSAPDEDTRATQGGGVTSPILSDIRAKASKAPCDCVSIMS